ncbi:MAG TPA: hypothetical protein VEQ58_21025 [Polyangiaceae bacterium]|nr:hypothetical protein [Polyangiaceae bacterium]
MENPQQSFEEFRYDFIAHLAARFDMPAEIVTVRLGEWLLDRSHDNQGWHAELARR